ncbi:MAG: ester cyclase [Verrucomicrobiales bacterium]
MSRAASRSGPAQFAEYQLALLGAMSDMKMEIVNAIEEGEYVCLYWSGSGTHTGGGMGIAPTGRSISCRGTTWLRVVDGVIVEGWDFWNQGQLMATLTAPAEATA